MVIGESRLELLLWLNQTLQLDYVKVEQCGTGAAYCQLMDAIYGGVPLAKVNFNGSISEYDSLSNMKVLQASFNKNGINKNIQVERLVKCRLQDNLELLQWFRRHWVDHLNINVDYDAVGRRKGAGNTSSRRTTFGSTPIASGSNPITLSKYSQIGTRGASTGTSVLPKRRVASSLLPSGSHLSSRTDSSRVGNLEQQLMEKSEEISRLTENVETCQVLAESLRTERNFYFNKLRELEILTKNIQLQYSRDDAIAQQVKDMSVVDVVEQVQEILYMTEAGFEVQDDAASF
ncbi:hypothetical protein PUMCH_003537 [Australozyma saopauloensis]|uniref:Uncharacterized protein n=1 Tax=Australozyma saopauloensis TaxID=291208 RepID=A0AAX4HC81_9ASCO|nr:hypothetical protein PUMCH_003537 [[Candida] saopauloensis]